MRVSTHLQFQRILLPIEFSPFSEPAVETALALAKKLGAAIDMLHVIEPFNGLEADPEVERFYRRLEKKAMSEFATLTARFEAEGLVVTWQVIIGHRALVIAQRAAELNADLIIMGTHGLESGSVQACSAPPAIELRCWRPAR